MSAIPSGRQSLRSVIAKLYPWLTGFVAVGAGAAKGLAIRTASGLLHLAGGPDDKGVVRIDDKGDGGQFVAAASPTLTYTGADGKTWTIQGAVVGAVVNFTVTAVSADPPGGKIVTKATEGSKKVTSA